MVKDHDIKASHAMEQRPPGPYLSSLVTFRDCTQIHEALTLGCTGTKTMMDMGAECGH